MNNHDLGANFIEIDFEPIGRRIDVLPGTTILDAARSAGIELSSVCGGMGSCGACRIRLMEGTLSSLTSTEKNDLSHFEVNDGIRFACQAKVINSVKIDIPPESLSTPQRLQVEGKGKNVDLDPVVYSIEVTLQPPGLSDLRSDLSRLRDKLSEMGLPQIEICHQALVSLSDELRNQNWKVSVILKNSEIIAILPSGSKIYGLAVDVGTTKLASYLVDLENGETVSFSGAMNPQISYGEDVISRISYSNDYVAGNITLQKILIDTLNNLTKEMSQGLGISIDQIVDSVIVGNTAMHHLLAGFSVHQLGTAPYVPSVSEAIEIPVQAIGLKIAPGAYIYLPPNIAGYVGADHVAMLLAVQAAQERQDAHTIVSLDIGTNTEISLYHWGRHLSCSCASGPAFEGAHINDGMRAAPGAIEKVRITNGRILLQTINGNLPIGICGSGILDVVAELFTNGIIDHRGVFLRDNANNYNGRKEFILSPASRSENGRNIVITRKDINEIQLAKGAIRAGVEVLLQEVGVTDEDIDEFIVAGAFGTYLDIESAIKIGMFPDLSREKFLQVGNAAGIGAKAMLVSKSQRRLASQISMNVEYVELTTHPGFTESYMAALAFPT